MSYRIGLTGGIGCGKSTVAALFRDLGAAIIDADTISHQLTQSSGAAIPAIRAAFGDACVDPSGALDRPRMRRLVFSDQAAKQRLEGILHPLIHAQMLSQARSAGGAHYVMLVIPLLFENPAYHELVQRTLVVDCAEATQISRTMRRSGMSEQEVRAIIAQQVPREERLRQADDVIDNDAGMDALRPQVERLHLRYLALSTGSD